MPLPFYFLSSSTPFYSTIALLLRLYVHFAQHCTNSKHSTHSPTPSLARTATSSQIFPRHTNPYPNSIPADYDRRQLPILRRSFTNFWFTISLRPCSVIHQSRTSSEDRGTVKATALFAIDPVMQPLEMQLLHGIFDWDPECEKLINRYARSKSWKNGRPRSGSGFYVAPTWQTRGRYVELPRSEEVLLGLLRGWQIKLGILKSTNY